jgi:hypothetical protein
MAETVNSGSVEPDQAHTCEGNKRRYLKLFSLSLFKKIQMIKITFPILSSSTYSARLL